MGPGSTPATAKIQELQDQKLRHFINRYLYPFSPYYRRLFDQNKINPKDIRTVADLRRIPFTSKWIFWPVPGTGTASANSFSSLTRKNPRRLAAGEIGALALTAALRGKTAVEDQLAAEFKPAFMTFTTGTTNQPVPFLYSNYDMRNLSISGGRMLNLFKIKSSENIVNTFPYAPHLAFWQVVFGALSANALALSTGGGKVMGTEGNIAVIQKMKPSVVLGVPGYVYHILREAADKNAISVSSRK